MAMTKTVDLVDIMVRPNTLPITQNRSFNFRPDDDVSGQPQIVQDICAAVWTDA